MGRYNVKHIQDFEVGKLYQLIHLKAWYMYDEKELYHPSNKKILPNDIVLCVEKPEYSSFHVGYSCKILYRDFVKYIFMSKHSTPNLGWVEFS
jgi:hypothetical protein